jgi:cellobiose phosphorylase
VRFPTADTRHPAVALLSNGRYGVMITAAGGGNSTWRDLDVTRWREDGTRDCWGQFLYVRDTGDRIGWTVGHQPLCRTADDCEVVFHPWQATIRRRVNGIETRLRVCVSPDHDAEVRVVTVVNHGTRPRDLDLTSYAEVCLNSRRADQAHPAFAKLFLQTEHVSASGALLCSRRPRTADQKPVWAVHVSPGDGRIEFETDRARFLGRGRTPANPAALDPDETLFGTTGPVLDPVFSLRRSLRLAPGAEARVVFVTGAAESRDEAVALAEQFQTLAAAERAFERARDRGRDELRDLGLTADDVALFNRLAGAVLFTDPALRSADAVAANRLGQPDLWPFAVSGDRPIVLVRLGAADEGGLARRLVQCHGYVRGRGMDLDLVILDARAREAVDRLTSDLQGGPAGPLLGKPGGVFVLSADTVPDDGRVLIEAAARAVLAGDRGLAG